MKRMFPDHNDIIYFVSRRFSFYSRCRRQAGSTQTGTTG